jgi:glutaredoxin
MEKSRFAGLNTQVLGISVDHVPCLKAWAESLGGINYPLLSDFWPHGEIAKRYGVLRSEGYTERALFIIDKEGIVRYIDIHNIDLQPDNDVLFAELAKLEPELARRQASRPVIQPVGLPKGGIVLYCTPWCPDCKKARQWLKECGLSFTEVDISRNASGAEQVRRWTGGPLTTPTFDINGTIVVDYDQEKLANVLKL